MNLAVNINQESNQNIIPHQDLWQRVLKDLREKYGNAVYTSWFSKLSLLPSSAQNFVIGAPTQFVRDWIKTNYFSSIQNLVLSSDSSIFSVELRIHKSENQNGIVDLALEPATVPSFTSSYTQDNTSYKVADNIFSSQLDARFTFDNFVVGNPNELAYAASRAVAESRKAVTESNPLFLYGGVGLGKTHLMHAIAWHIKQTNSSRKVIYMSAEKFMYQFVRALRNKDVMSFKEHFRSVDVLMIDDIQFICGKESTQEEFFHTFNALIDNSRQMVISCDRSPTDLDNIEERIKSRLGWGLVADVHSTTYELRLGILESKVDNMSVSVPMNVIEFLAAKITSNVRELEGALNKVIAHSTLVGREITLSSCQEILRDLLRSNEKLVTIDDIQKKVAELYNIKIADMSSSKRQRNVARPRQIAMYISKHLTTKSLNEIGKKFGKKDHTTVMHACKQIEKLRSEDLELQEEINLLERALQG
ncbi:MAG: chromosomal replication initiator protein DnaA [Rickettsiaceae bacterium]|nr:chromosomal replication initiator protein DnaA [Rickettsiaceae bacterium]